MITKMVTNNEAVRVRGFGLRCANKEKAASLGGARYGQPLSLQGLEPEEYQMPLLLMVDR